MPLLDIVRFFTFHDEFEIRVVHIYENFASTKGKLEDKEYVCTTLRYSDHVTMHMNDLTNKYLVNLMLFSNK